MVTKRASSQPLERPNLSKALEGLSEGWIPASDLKIGGAVLTSSGQIGVVTLVRAYQKPQEMYNLEVARANSFSVGSSGWIVHNARKLTPSFAWGGKHEDTKVQGTKTGTESHHPIADAISPFDTNKAPAVRMDALNDHPLTGSYKNSKASQAWRDAQKALLDQGLYDDAYEMGIKDMRDNFGSKYDPHIQEMTDSLPKLPCGKIDWAAIPRK